jgi:hypothetical protein
MCYSLKGISLPDGITEIESNTFIDCISLAKVKFPSKLQEIGLDAFRGCEVLTNVQLPNGLKTIWYDAFYGCIAMGTVTIPKSVTKISPDALGFYDDGKIRGFRMRVYKGSAAETYAKENGLAYDVISTATAGKGDVNGDGSVNVADLSKIAAHIKGKKKLSSTKNADINGDGSVNVTDISRIAAYIKGKKKF